MHRPHLICAWIICIRARLLPQTSIADILVQTQYEGRETIDRIAKDMAVFVETPDRVLDEDRADRRGGRAWWDLYPGC